MERHLHKRFPDEHIKSLFERYLSKEIEINYLLEIVGVKWRRFFELLKEYWKDPDGTICTGSPPFSSRIHSSYHRLSSF